MPTKIIMVEDDADIANLVVHYLGREGYGVEVVRDGATALNRIRVSLPDLLVLDLMLPGLDGLEVCKRLRAAPQTARLPILMLTAKGEESDKIVGLELGADDYLVKPFSPKELVARIKALLRRAAKPEIQTSRYTFGDLILDAERHEATFRGKEIALTAKEFGLLHQLFQNRGRVLTRETLLDRVWGYEADVTTRTVDVHIRRLREKIPFLEEAIITVKSLGYKLKDTG